MEEKVLRLNKWFEYLRSIGMVHTQADVAKAMGASRPNVSSALKGDGKVLTDKFLKRFANAFDVLSQDWLLTGEGPMLTSDLSGSVHQQSSGDYSPNVNGTGNVVVVGGVGGGAVEDMATALRKALGTIETQSSTISTLTEIIQELRQQINENNNLKKG